MEVPSQVTPGTTQSKSHSHASVQRAYAYCEEVARSHYENFPVASMFLPREKRPYVAAIYAFARAADDFADEGAYGSSRRLFQLDDWERNLDDCFAGYAKHPVFIAIADTIERFAIPLKPFKDLLVAFRLDAVGKRFATFTELLNYCEHSANPIGRLVLYVFEDTSDRKFMLSDNICTALQLTNFWQDVSVDCARDRIYIPLEDFDRYSYTERELRGNVVNESFRALIKFQVERTKELFRSGMPLLMEAVPELRIELRLTLNGGMAILKKIEKRAYDVLRGRPTISLIDKLAIAFKVAVMRSV